MEKKADDAKAKPPTVPVKYADADQSGLTWDVAPGDQTHDISLD